MKFKVVAVSDNFNSFGLRNMIMISDRGEAWQAAGNAINIRPVGYVFQLNDSDPVMEQLTSRNLELPSRLPDPPPAVFAEAWPAAATLQQSADNCGESRVDVEVMTSAGPLVSVGDVLPCPRLELRWIKTGDDWGTRECVYALAVPLRPLDCRKEDDAGDDVQTELTVEFGRTRVTSGNSRRPVDADGKVDTPYRDGAHASWDATALGGLPVYAVCEEVVTCISPGWQQPVLALNAEECQVVRQLFEAMSLKNDRTVAEELKELESAAYVRDFTPGPGQIRLHRLAWCELRKKLERLVGGADDAA